jgi:hypothetical protein
MKAEDVDGEVDDINSSDSDEEDDPEEAPILKEWNQDFSDIMKVNEGHDSAWEYHSNSISVGSLYPDKQRLQDAITSWAMSMQRVFKTAASNKKYLIVECSKERCPARVHGYLRKNDTFWVVSDHVQHICIIKNQLVDHKNLSSTLVARLFHSQIVEGKAMEVKAIQKIVKQRYKYKISYGKA